MPVPVPVPVLGSVLRVPDARRRPSPGVLVADADEAAAVLRRWTQDPAELAGLRRAALTYAERQLRGASVWDGLATVVVELLPPARRRADPAAPQASRGG